MGYDKTTADLLRENEALRKDAEIARLGILLCELIECDAAGPFSDAMPPALLERWQGACDQHIDRSKTHIA